MNNIKDFFAFVNCRHMIWYRRFKQGKDFPWSDDPILSEYKFTNVYRELDRGTKFLWESVSGDTTEQILFQIVFYRFINKPDYFIWTGDTGGVGNIEYDVDLQILCDLLRAYKKETKKSLFNTAYRVICNTPAGDSRIDELQRTLKEFQDNYINIVEQINNCNSFKELNTILQQIRHVGPFLAYEIAIDLINLEKNLKKRFTENDWANFGPGAFVGLRYIYPDEERLEKENQIIGLGLGEGLRRMQEEYLPRDFPYYQGKKLSLRNIEHSLCEYGKYCNIRDGKGRARPKFTPPKIVYA